MKGRAVRSPLDQLLRRARKRVLANRILAHACLATAMAAGGLVLLLLLGTRLVNWPWLLLLFAAGLGWGLFRASRRLPSDYVLAQRIDRRLGLSDSLSTALFFRETRKRGASPDLRAAQWRQAESLSAGISAADGLPVVMPAQVRLAASLLLAAGGLFLLRFGLSRTLDLRPPIAQVVFDSWRGAKQATATDQARTSKPRVPAPEPVAALDGIETVDEAQFQAPDAPKAEVASDEQVLGRRPAGDRASSGDSLDGSGESSNDAPSPQVESREDARATGRAASPPATRKNPPPSAEDSDLLNKLRNAMADLLAKLKIQPPAVESEREVAGRQGSQTGAMREASGRMGKPGEGRGQSREAGEGQQAGEEGPGPENAQAARGQAADKGTGRPDSSPRERSGIGKEDGSKELREAEQLAAMGKISEILGKRAQNVTGEFTVEVASSHNQLRTAYSRRSARHADAGGEIHRDEIPLIYQHYVQRYFEEVRKEAAAQQTSRQGQLPGAGQ